MPQNYRITALHGSREWEGNFGPMVDYRVTFEGNSDIVTIAQKPETLPPQVGQELYGDIQPSTYGPKFKKSQGQRGGHTTISHQPPGRSTGPTTPPSPPQRSKEQVALELAVRAFKRYEASDNIHLYMETIGMLADEFYKAIDHVGRTAREPSPSYSEEPLPEYQG